MIRRFERWLAAVLPPRHVTLGILALLAAAYATSFALRLAFRGPDDLPNDGIEYTMMFVFVLNAAATCYGLWRVSYHPGYSERYRHWLTTVPWTIDRPLPAGPATLVWQDAVVITWATLASWSLGAPLQVLTAMPPLAFLSAWCLGVGYMNFRLGEDAAVVGAIVAWSLAFLMQSQFENLLLVALAACAVAAGCVATQWGLRRSLRSFPWDENPRWQFIETLVHHERSLVPLASPHIRSPMIEKLRTGVSLRQSIVLAVMAGWIAFVATVGSDTANDATFRWSGAIAVSAYLVCPRLLIYGRRFRPPISLAARITTGKLVIPGYDKVLLGPLLTMLSATCLPALLLRAGTPLSATMAVTTFAVVLALFGVGPNLYDWHLTGEHRIVLAVDPKRQRRDGVARRGS